MLKFFRIPSRVWMRRGMSHIFTFTVSGVAPSRREWEAPDATRLPTRLATLTPLTPPPAGGGRPQISNVHRRHHTCGCARPVMSACAWQNARKGNSLHSRPVAHELLAKMKSPENLQQCVDTIFMSR